MDGRCSIGTKVSRCSSYRVHAFFFLATKKPHSAIPFADAICTSIQPPMSTRLAISPPCLPCWFVNTLERTLLWGDQSVLGASVMTQVGNESILSAIENQVASSETKWRVILALHHLHHMYRTDYTKGTWTAGFFHEFSKHLKINTVSEKYSSNTQIYPSKCLFCKISDHKHWHLLEMQV